MLSVLLVGNFIGAAPGHAYVRGDTTQKKGHQEHISCVGRVPHNITACSSRTMSVALTQITHQGVPEILCLYQTRFEGAMQWCIHLAIWVDHLPQGRTQEARDP